jgi:bifunctional non-homologous end joining protein LigD
VARSPSAPLRDALSRGQAERLTYHVFDLLHLDGRDLTGLPLIERKALLEPVPIANSMSSEW